jgi:hypothetical protein
MSAAGRALAIARKLRGRSPTELRERLAQSVAGSLERAGLLDAREPGPRAFARLFGDAHSGLSPDAWRARIRARGAEGPRFMAGLDDRGATVAAFHAHDPAHAAAVLTRAESLAAGRFDLLGYHALDFGTPIDWHLDPVARVRAPMAHWSRIAYLDPKVAGDHKVVWELNRHQWLVALGEAYWLTGDERWARAIVERLVAWMDANPPKRGVNWASSLEVGFRAIAWCWVIAMLRDSDALGSEVLARLTAFLALHARHLERNLSTWFSPNTHLTGEALALFHVGLLFPELRGAARWREHGWRTLVDQLPIHARADGVYFEQAVYYQRYTVDFYTHLLVLAERNGIAGGRAAIGPHLERLVEHLVHLARHDGTTPLTGDEDGGRLVWLAERAPDDVRSAAATAAVLFARPDFAFAAGEMTAESIWLLGPDAPERFAALGAREPDGTSRAFTEGGVYVMRDGWDAASHHLAIDCGPHGAMNCGHAHADALSFEASVAGRPVLVDPGTYVYTASPALRDWFRSTEAHNALAIDDESSSVSDGAFQWRHVARCETLAWYPFAAADWFEGRHDGYARLASPATHRRGVLFVKPDEGPRYWIVRDVVESEGEHDLALTFQCAADVSVDALDCEGAELAFGEAPAMRLAFTADGALDAPRVAVDERWVSRRYGARRPAPRLRLLLRSRGRVSIASVLLPAALGADTPFPTARRVHTTRGLALEITDGAFRDIVLFDAADAGPVEGVETDAAVAWVRRDAHGASVAAMLAGGTRRARGGGSELAARGAASARLVSGGWIAEGDGARVVDAPRPSAAHTSLVTRL